MSVSELSPLCHGAGEAVRAFRAGGRIGSRDGGVETRRKKQTPAPTAALARSELDRRFVRRPQPSTCLSSVEADSQELLPINEDEFTEVHVAEELATIHLVV